MEETTVVQIMTSIDKKVHEMSQQFSGQLGEINCKMAELTKEVKKTNGDVTRLKDWRKEDESKLTETYEATREIRYFKRKPKTFYFVILATAVLLGLPNWIEFIEDRGGFWSLLGF